MKKRLNVLLLIDNYLCNAGATVAITSFMRQWRSSEMGEAFILTRTLVGNLDDDIKKYIYLYNGDIKHVLKENDIDVVDYFFSSRSLIKKSLLTIARRTINDLQKDVVIVTTVCQRPSDLATLLTVTDITLSDHLVFIDDAAYNDPLYAFIPENRKSRIYFGGTKEYEDLTERVAKEKKENKDVFIFGRGSTLNKCPSDILDVFDKINVPNKFFCIAGIPNDSWLGLLAKDRHDVVVVPSTSYVKWLEICCQFDVFLYYLPEGAHSSIDGTLGDAMMMKIPPIVYGPQAPKERIIHEKNGYIANTKDEIVYYAELLYRNESLRKSMGESARATQIEMFSMNNTLSYYNCLFNKLLCDNSNRFIKIPMMSKLQLFKKRYFFSYWILLIKAFECKLFYLYKVHKSKLTIMC